MALQDELFVNGAWVSSDNQNSDTSVVDSVTPLDSGEAIADVYTLVISNVSAGVSCTVTVSTESTNNPYNGRVVNGVLLNGTSYSNIIPGYGIVIDNTVVNGDEADITIGNHLGTIAASGAGAGTPTAGVRHRVVNTGVTSVNGCVARLLTNAVMVKKVGNVFAFVNPFAPGATEKTLGGGSSRMQPYNLAISGVAGSGAGKTATLSIDGGAFPANSILDVTTGVTQNGTGLKAISPNYMYRIVLGPLTGVEFSLSANCANGNTANILIFPSRYIQIAPDVAGAEGAYGTADVVLTQTGQPAGTIQGGGAAFYWTRLLVPESSDSESNPYPANVSLEGNDTGAANWLG